MNPKEAQPPYYIVITRKNQVLMSFLRVRAIVNGKDIYPLNRAETPVWIEVNENNPRVVISDGYHFTKPVELVYHHLHTYYFKVVCVIGDVPNDSGRERGPARILKPMSELLLRRSRGLRLLV